MMPPAGMTLPRKGKDLEDESEQRTDDDQAERDRAQSLEKVRRRPPQGRPDGGVAQDKRQEERGQPQEPKDGLREIGSGAAREIADVIPRGRNVGERGVLGIVADDADEGEEGQKDEQDTRDLDGQSGFPAAALAPFPFLRWRFWRSSNSVFSRPDYSIFSFTRAASCVQGPEQGEEKVSERSSARTFRARPRAS